MNETERDKIFEKNVLSSHSWNHYFLAVGRFLLVFFILMLALQLHLFYLHKGLPWGLAESLMVVLVILSLVSAFTLMIRRLPMGVFMLAMPIVPLCMLIIVLTSFPVVRYVEKEFAAFGLNPPIAFKSS